MADLTDYDIQKIREYIDSFLSTSSSISRMLNADYSGKLSKAKNALNSYSKDEEQALKTAKKEIELVFGSSGVWTSKRNNINAAMKQKGEDCAREVGEIFDQYSSEIHLVLERLPQIGDYHSQHIIFERTEYAGDIDYTETFGVFTFDDSGVNNQNTMDSIKVYGTDLSPDSMDYESTKTNTASTIRSNQGHIVTEKQKYSAENDSETTIDTYITESQTMVLTIDSLNGNSIRKLICSNVSEIQANAFKGIQGLELIVLSNSIKTINLNAFRGLQNKCIIAFVDSRETVESSLNSINGLKNRKALFNYHDGDEQIRDAEVFSVTEPATAEQSKRTVIRKNTPLDNDNIKDLFLSRNAGYELTMDELNKGIANANTSIDKDLIVLEALKEKRFRDLQSNSFWNYAKTMQCMIKICEKLGRTDEELNSIFALFFLDSSGYRMMNGKYSPYMQDPYMMYYHPKMQMQNLAQIQEEHNLSEQELIDRYEKSPYVIELAKVTNDAYYSLDTSIRMMLEALENPHTIYYPAHSKYKRIH